MFFNRRLFRTPLVLGSLFALASFSALAGVPLFGPQTYERTAEPPVAETDSFTSPAAGSFVLWVQNGDEGDSRVASEIDVNGTPVVTPSSFPPSELFHRSVTLVGGSNTIAVTLDGDPGSFITVLILPVGARPDVTVGRLILPYGSSTDLVLNLKNGSHGASRYFRVVFYDKEGNPVARSERAYLAPRASLSQMATSFVASGSWTEGSIEIFYSGRGAGRLFGEAASKDTLTGIESIVPLQQAGSRRLDPAEQAKKGSH